MTVKEQAKFEPMSQQSLPKLVRPTFAEFDQNYTTIISTDVIPQSSQGDTTLGWIPVRTDAWDSSDDFQGFPSDGESLAASISKISVFPLNKAAFIALAGVDVPKLSVLKSSFTTLND